MEFYLITSMLQSQVEVTKEHGERRARLLGASAQSSQSVSQSLSERSKMSESFQLKLSMITGCASEGSRWERRSRLAQEKLITRGDTECPQLAWRGLRGLQLFNQCLNSCKSSQIRDEAPRSTEAVCTLWFEKASRTAHLTVAAPTRPSARDQIGATRPFYVIHVVHVSGQWEMATNATPLGPLSSRSTTT